ncbi:MAG: TRAP transporter large permease subunit [Gammaproteobacteria bacterium]|nr:TRAP transporter large permease subunit [Gammaproteobacteria bacterium]NIR82457.1 TRAP transporter large permease subunit [Gammaproteobacteria bacterium]NIR88453.1 TRAP transporter large permease subunit [Gammaproteobacteria bacterium]NIU03593.1 TRAP transporter large permease subunit [Gammaproteobacteria bacterium]NIV50945.1 TRAP transporter large permease subunit [Gammaproteobacteria bacterium]
MAPEFYALLMILFFFVALFSGMPVGFGIMAVGLVFGFLGGEGFIFNILPSKIYGVLTNYTLLTIPLFVFMGLMLERSKIAERMLDVIGHLSGRLPGGMCLAIILVGVLMGAATGIVGASVVALTLIGLPSLLRRNHRPSLACGTVCASGTLGQIIPPSLVLIVLADILNLSVGTLFAAAMMPGLMLAGLYLLYLFWMVVVAPQALPPIPKDERDAVSARQLARDFMVSVVPPLALMVAVLGSIIGGFAAPTEAASVGSVGALLLTAAFGRLTWPVFKDVCYSSLRISATIFFILIGAQVFALAFRGLAGENLIGAMFDLVPGGFWGALIFMLALIFILGFFLEWIQISYIVLPLLMPFVTELRPGLSLTWIAMLVAVNLNTSFLTPPFGWSLLFMKGVAPPGVTTQTIYRGIVPFVLLQLIGLGLVVIFPEIALWLPRAIGWESAR